MEPAGLPFRRSHSLPRSRTANGQAGTAPTARAGAGAGPGGTGPGCRRSEARGEMPAVGPVPAQPLYQPARPEERSPGAAPGSGKDQGTSPGAARPPPGPPLPLPRPPHGVLGAPHRGSGAGTDRAPQPGGAAAGTRHHLRTGRGAMLKRDGTAREGTGDRAVPEDGTSLQPSPGCRHCPPAPPC